MSAKSTRKKQPTPPVVWAITITLAIIGGFYFLQAYLGVIILGLLLAFIFFPLHEKIKTRVKSESLASAMTTVISILLVGIPALIIMTLTVAQTLLLVDDVSSDFTLSQEHGINEIINDLTTQTNKAIENFVGISEAIQQSDVRSFLENTLPNALRAVANSMLGLFRGIPTFITMFIIYLFVFTGGLTRGRQIIQTVKDLSPLDKKTNELYVSRIGAMAKAMLKGQFVIAATQGFESAAVLALFGFSEYFLFFAVLLTFLSFIPLGAGIITIPLGIIMIVFGNVAGGIIVLLNHFLIVTNIDNVIRPKLVPKNAELHPALLILSAFAGVTYFGFLGVIYGPIIMIIISTTIESYLAYKKRVSA